MCFVWIWEQTAIISLYSINWLVFITEPECLLRGTDSKCNSGQSAVIAVCTIYRSDCHTVTTDVLCKQVDVRHLTVFFPEILKKAPRCHEVKYTDKKRAGGRATTVTNSHIFWLFLFPTVHIRSTYKWQSHWRVFIPPPQSRAFTPAPYIWLGSDSVRRRFQIAITTLVTAASLF